MKKARDNYNRKAQQHNSLRTQPIYLMMANLAETCSVIYNKEKKKNDQ
jgi:hypothetical protein